MSHLNRRKVVVRSWRRLSPALLGAEGQKNELVDGFRSRSNHCVVDAGLSKRSRAVLYAVVSEFIATGEPVGSRTLARKYGFSLSAATIRNVLADLEELGFLQQPHTSAGRVPTAAAYRLFIDALMRLRQLSENELGKIHEHFGELRPGADIVREAGRLLSDMTGAAAILVRPRVETRTLRKVQFIPTRPLELLAVIVMSDGTVENRYIALDTPMTGPQIERIHAMLEEIVDGNTLSAIRDNLAKSAATHRDELGELQRLGLSVVEAAIDKHVGKVDVVIEGQARLLDRPEFSSGEHMRTLLRALDDHERLLSLLDRTLIAKSVQVMLGDEADDANEVPVSLVAAPYGDADGLPSGALGVLGPRRMDYPAVVPLVRATADAMSLALRRDSDRRNG